MNKLFILLGAINAFLAVGLGAFGAHGLKERLSEDMLAVYQTAVQYHMFHALGLILIGVISVEAIQAAYLKGAGWLLFVGIILFSGSLYCLSISGIRILGAITPFGGLCFLAGWLVLAWAAFKSRVFGMDG
ncbi:MAG: DUF423 domain-containing protein, partial [Pseudomonadota bacterium]